MIGNRICYWNRLLTYLLTHLLTHSLTYLLTQALHNDVRNKRYAKALHAAIELGHSHRILTTLTAILEEEGVDIPNEDPFDANAQVNARLNSYVALWSDNDIEKVVGYMKEWNTNARYSYVSQCFISSLFTGVIFITHSLTHSHTYSLTPSCKSREIIED